MHFEAADEGIEVIGSSRLFRCFHLIAWISTILCYHGDDAHVSCKWFKRAAKIRLCNTF